MIVRILVAAALAMLVAAPGPELAGSLQIEAVEEVASHVDDEVDTQLVPTPAGGRPRAPLAARSEDVVPPGPALDRIFRPPRTPRAWVLASSSGRAL